MMCCAAWGTFGDHAGHDAQAARGNHLTNTPLHEPRQCHPISPDATSGANNSISIDNTSNTHSNTNNGSNSINDSDNSNVSSTSNNNDDSNNSNTSDSSDKSNNSTDCKRRELLAPGRLAAKLQA